MRQGDAVCLEVIIARPDSELRSPEKPSVTHHGILRSASALPSTTITLQSRAPWRFPRPSLQRPLLVPCLTFFIPGGVPGLALACRFKASASLARALLYETRTENF